MKKKDQYNLIAIKTAGERSPGAIKSLSYKSPNTFALLLAGAMPPPRFWIRVSGSYFEDEMPRAFPLEQDENGVYITHVDGTTTRLDQLPKHLWDMESGEKYETEGEIFL